MGIDLSDIVESRPLAENELQGKVVALDAFNVLYQFLSSIRQPDGTPLMDSKGRVTSHLQGIVSRTTNLVREGVKPVYVFDGDVMELKRDTIAQRRERRDEAQKAFEQAKAAGDTLTAAKMARQSTRLTDDIIRESKELLEMLGIPWVQAPHDGEAQASRMCATDQAWGVASQDFDCLLFGCPRLYRNLGYAGKRRTPAGYVKVVPEVLEIEGVLRHLSLTREQLVDLAILVGTDFNEGVKGIGPKKALKLIREKGKLENAGQTISPREMEAVRRIFLEPSAKDDVEFSFGHPDKEKVMAYLCQERGFSPERLGPSLDALERGMAARQQTLESWF